MANYSIPNWAMERYQDIDDYMLLTMSLLVETDEMKRLYSGRLTNKLNFCFSIFICKNYYSLH